jgi:acylphosphatase
MNPPSSEPHDQVAAAVFVSGQVQGVCYRAFAHDAAVELGLFGFVRNLPDGRVEAAVEGPRAQVEKFLERLRAGPPRAQVTKLDVRWKTATGAMGAFRISG